METSNKRIAINSILNIFRLSLTVIVPLVVFPYTSRIFGADGIGVLEWVKSTIAIFILLAQLGIYTYAVREGARIRDDKVKFSKLAHELLIINSVSTFLSYVVLAICILFVPIFAQYFVLLLIYSVNIAMTALGLDWVFGVYEEYKYITIRQIVTQIVSLLCIFLFVKTKEDTIVYLIIMTVSQSGANLFNIIHATKYLSFKPQKKYEVLKHVLPVLIFFFSKIAANAYNYIDNFMIGLISNETAVGLYGASSKMNAIFITCFTAMGVVYLPKLVGHIKNHDVEEYNSFLEKVLRIKVMFLVPIAIGIAVLSTPVLLILSGPDFLGADVTLKLLCLVLFLVVVSNFIQNDILITRGLEKYVFLITSVSALSNIAASAVLIRFFADKGAAIGSVVAECVALVIGFCVLRKKNIFRFSSFVKYTYNYFLAGLIMGIVCYALTCIISSFWIMTIATVAAGAIVYFLALAIMRDKCLSTVFGFVRSVILRRKSKQ